MDPALLKEREAFKKRALAQPAVEKRRHKDGESSKSRPSKKVRPAPRPQQKTEFDYKSAVGTSHNRFAVLAKIVKYMKERHQEGDSHALNMDEILDETQQLDINPRDKHWLETQALLSNPKIEVVNGDTFKYKPKYNIKDKKGLLRLLDKRDRKGEGGVLEEDVIESMANAQQAMKHLGDRILYVTRPLDKKRVLFYNDKSYAYSVDGEIQKLWRSVAVEGVDESKIEDHLHKQGITSMQDVGVRVVPQKRRKVVKRRPAKFKMHNNHLDNVLQDFSSNS